jgi:histone H3/H4
MARTKKRPTKCIDLTHLQRGDRLGIPIKLSPGTYSPRDKQRYIRTAKLVIKPVVFQRLVRQLTTAGHYKVKWQVLAMRALHEAGESYIEDRFAAMKRGVTAEN